MSGSNEKQNTQANTVAKFPSVRQRFTKYFLNSQQFSSKLPFPEKLTNHLRPKSNERMLIKKITVDHRLLYREQTKLVSQKVSDNFGLGRSIKIRMIKYDCNKIDNETLYCTGHRSLYLY